MSSHKKEASKEDVKKFWEQNTCGTQAGISKEGTQEYYDAIEKFRYTHEPFIHELVQFPKWKGKKTLEIGMGAGTDFIQFAKAGAEAHGIDLTEKSIEHVKRRLASQGLTAQISQADAENLPFSNNIFDFVYSWGVIHHTPDTQKAVQEIYRVLKPGGSFLVMLYHKFSWLVLYLVVRRGLLKGELFTKGLERIISEHTEWNNPQNPLTKVYSKREAKQMFRQFPKLAVRVIKTQSYSNDWRGRIFQWLNNIFPKFGWYLIIEGQK